jgi:hypothetical protein
MSSKQRFRVFVVLLLLILLVFTFVSFRIINFSLLIGGVLFLFVLSFWIMVELYLKIQKNIFGVQQNFNTQVLEIKHNQKEEAKNIRELLDIHAIQRKKLNKNLNEHLIFLRSLGALKIKEKIEAIFSKLVPSLFNYESILYVGASKQRMNFLTDFRKRNYQITVLEAFKENVDYLKRFSWIEKVFLGDVRSFKFPAKKKYDVIFWWHGPEHIEKKDLEKTLKKLESVCKKVVVLGCPFGVSEQGEAYGNSYERHLSFLDGTEFTKLGYDVEYLGEKDLKCSNIIAIKKIKGRKK